MRSAISAILRSGARACEFSRRCACAICGGARAYAQCARLPILLIARAAVRRCVDARLYFCRARARDICARAFLLRVMRALISLLFRHSLLMPCARKAIHVFFSRRVCAAPRFARRAIYAAMRAAIFGAFLRLPLLMRRARAPFTIYDIILRHYYYWRTFIADDAHTFTAATLIFCRHCAARGAAFTAQCAARRQCAIVREAAVRYFSLIPDFIDFFHMRVRTFFPDFTMLPACRCARAVCALRAARAFDITFTRCRRAIDARYARACAFLRFDAHDARARHIAD